MLSYLYTLTNNYTGRSFSIGQNPDGTTFCASGRGLALQQYPTFELEVRNEERDKTGQHGIWDFFSFYGKRNITFQGILKEDTHQKLIAKQRIIQDVLSLPAQPEDGNDGYITLSWEDDDGTSWQIDVKLQQDVQFSRELRQQTQASFFISLKAKDPTILSTEQFQETSLLGYRMQSFIIPAFLPNNINVTLTNQIQLYQNGNTDAPAIYRLFGPGDNPKVTRFDETLSEETQLLDFEETTWTGGTATEDLFIEGTGARQITSTGAQETMSITGSFDLDYSDSYIQETQLLSCDSDTGVTGTYDATNVDLDFSLKTEGNASIKFDIDVSATVSNRAGITKTDISAVDVYGYENLFMECDVWIPDPTYITGIYIALGSDSNANGLSDTATLQSDGSAFTSGWNTIRMYFNDMTAYGTGLNQQAIDSFTGEFVYSASQADMTDCRFDNISIYGNIERQFVRLFVHLSSVDSMEPGAYDVGYNYIKFIENAGTDEFVAEYYLGNPTLRDGWNEILVLKDNFTAIGSPSWEAITEIELSIKARSGYSLTATFDDLRVCNNTYSEKKLELTYTLLDGEYVDFDTQEGTILKDDGTDLSGYLTTDSEWFTIKPRENTIMYESDEDPTITLVDPTERWDIFWHDALL